MKLKELGTTISNQLSIIVAFDLLRVIAEFVGPFKGVIVGRFNPNSWTDLPFRFKDIVLELHDGRIALMCGDEIGIYDIQDFDKPLYTIEDVRPWSHCLYLDSTQQILCMSVGGVPHERNRLHRLGDSCAGRGVQILQDFQDQVTYMAPLDSDRAVCILSSDELVVISGLQSGELSYEAVAENLDVGSLDSVHSLGGDRFALVYRDTIKGVDLNGGGTLKIQTYTIPDLSSKCEGIVYARAWRTAIIFLYRPIKKETVSVFGIFDLDNPDRSCLTIKSIEMRLEGFAMSEEGCCRYLTSEGLAEFHLSRPGEEERFSAPKDSHWGKLIEQSRIGGYYMKALSDGSLMTIFDDGQGFRWV